jgi:hypothetical protein
MAQAVPRDDLPGPEFQVRASEMGLVAAGLVPELLRWERDFKTSEGRDPTYDEMRRARHVLVTEWLLMTKEVQRAFTAGDPHGVTPPSPSAAEQVSSLT